MGELQHVGLGGIELEGDQPRPSSRIDRLADELRAWPGTDATEGMDEPIEAGRQTDLVLGEVDTTMQGRRKFAGGKARQDEWIGHLEGSRESLPHTRGRRRIGTLTLGD
ncbi:MAG: hypothetical protein Q8L22_29935 [Reyranella sp.]|nr:hypothetical protein [Reyranella sp.]